MRRLRERPDKHYRGERCTSHLNSHANDLVEALENLSQLFG